MAGVKAQVGQVFAVPLDADKFAVGQVAAKRSAGELYLLAYDDVHVGLPTDPTCVRGKQPFIATLSLDAKIWHGHWPVIGNLTDNLIGISHPAFKVRVDGVEHIELRDGSLVRRVRADEANLLRFRTVVAPIRIEKAIKAHHGLGEWEPHFAELLYEYATTSSKLAQQ